MERGFADGLARPNDLSRNRDFWLSGVHESVVPAELLQPALAKYRDGTPVLWVQEEPGNMGAGYDFRVRFGDQLIGRWPFAGVSRPASASPAGGSANVHKREQATLIAKAFGEKL